MGGYVSQKKSNAVILALAPVTPQKFICGIFREDQRLGNAKMAAGLDPHTPRGARGPKQGPGPIGGVGSGHRLMHRRMVGVGVRGSHPVREGPGGGCGGTERASDLTAEIKPKMSARDRFTPHPFKCN